MTQATIIFLCLIFVTIMSNVSIVTSKRDNHLKEIQLASLKDQRKLTSSDRCEKDSQRLEENTWLQDSFSNVLHSFSESFNETNAWTYCDSARNGQAVSLDCLVDYSSFQATSTYSSQCKSLGASQYNISILMLCSSNSNSLQMDLKNIPSCLGKSCDSRYLYLSLINVLRGVQDSLGTGSKWSWECTYYHDFESLMSAPSAAIEIPEVENPEQSHGSKRSLVSLSTTFICLMTIVAFAFM